MNTTATDFFEGNIRGAVRVADASKIFDLVGEVVGRIDSPEDFGVELGNMETERKTRFGAATQYAVLAAVQALAYEKGVLNPGGYTTLGQTIMAQQSHKIEQYGERAYALSLKQCTVIVRECWAALK